MRKTVRRVACAAGIVAALASTAAAGFSSADSVGPVRGSSDAVSFERSVSGETVVGGSVSTGDVITVTNRIERKLGWLVYHVKDVHPTCMEAVPNTSTWKVSGKTYTNDPDGPGTKVPGEVTSGPGWVQIKAGSGGSWAAAPLIWTQDYLIKCSAGQLNTGGLEWSTTWVGESGNKRPNVGPDLTVGPGRPSIAISPSDASVANDVRITVRHPEGLPGMPVALTSDGKTLPGCGNLVLNGNRQVSCTWVPTKAGKYPLKAVIGADDPVTVHGSVDVAAGPGAGSIGVPGLDSGSLYTGSLNGLGS